jgi:hypothetical protein
MRFLATTVALQTLPSMARAMATTSAVLEAPVPQQPPFSPGSSDRTNASIWSAS